MPRTCLYGRTASGKCRRKYTKACKRGVRRPPSFLCTAKKRLNFARASSSSFSLSGSPGKRRLSSSSSSSRPNDLRKYGFKTNKVAKYHNVVEDKERDFGIVPSKDIRAMFLNAKPKATVRFVPEPISIIAKDEVPDAVIVDPAGIRYIPNTSGAGGVSGILYKHFKIKKLDVPASAQVLDAFAATYDGVKMIHAFGPNFNDESWFEAILTDTDAAVKKATQQLTSLYVRIFKEFCQNFKAPTELRLVAVSSGIFAGNYASFMPMITLQSIQDAFTKVPELKGRVVRLRTQRGMYNYIARNGSVVLPTTTELGLKGPDHGFVADDQWVNAQPN